MAGEMEPAEDMDQTEPDSTVEAPDPTGGGQEQEMVGGDQQVEQQPQQVPEEAEVEGSEEGADDDDEARSEATFRFRVEGFSTIKDSTLSESCVIRNLPWKIMIMQRTTHNRQEHKIRGLLFAVQW